MPSTDLNRQPWWNDFDPSKGFVQTLFVPKRPVQARELTQLQDLIQYQVSKFGEHIFAHGSPVIGGQITYREVNYVKLLDTYSGNPVVPSEFKGKVLEEKTSGGVATGVKVTCLEALDAEDSDPISFYFVYSGQGTEITEGNTLFVEGTNVGATIDTGAGTFGPARMFHVSEGVFFLNGWFVSTPTLQIVPEKYERNPTGTVGLTFEEIIVTSDDDESLLNNARGYPSYGGTGADRLRIDVDIAYIEPGDDTPDNFVQLYEVEGGITKNLVQYPIYSDIARELARRTHEESGNYTVRPYSMNLTPDNKNFIVSITRSGVAGTTATVLTAQPHNLSSTDPINIAGVTGADAGSYNGSFVVATVASENQFTYTMSIEPAADAIGENITFEREDHYTATLGPGKSYIYGFEHERVSNTPVSALRARDVEEVENYQVASAYGNYVIVESLSGGVIDATGLNRLDILNDVDDDIGSARVRYLRLHSGTPGSGSEKYRLYLYDFDFVGTWSFADARSFDDPVGGATCTVASDSISNGNTTLRDGAINSLLFSIPQSAVKSLSPGGTDDTSYTAPKRFDTVASGTTVSISVVGNQTFFGPTEVDFVGTDTHYNHYVAFNSSTGTILEVSDIELNATATNCTMTIDESGVDVTVIATIQETLKAAKTKTTTAGQTAATGGDITKASPTLVLQNADIIRITGIYHSGSMGVPATDSDPDIKDLFELDNGQRDNFYDFGRVTLKLGATPPVGDILVEYDYYAHTGSGYFSVDSYSDTDYEDIPKYKIESSGKLVSLSDVIDFRPTRTGSTTHGNDQIPTPNSLITADYEFYLPRKDRVVINASGDIKIITGESARNPFLPPEPEDAMTLYELAVPAYTPAPKDISAKFIENKRYTMRDIGRLDKRITRVEYYTALTFLEMDTKNRPVLDQSGLERFKNGFLVDNFRGHGLGDVTNADYKAAMDMDNRELRPPFNPQNVKLKFNGSLTNGTQVGSDTTGYFAINDFTKETWISNLSASKSESVNPYLVTEFVGSLTAVPPSDDWIDTTVRPEVVTNLEGDQNAWEAIAEAVNSELGPGWGTQWNDWESIWTGVSTSTSTSTSSNNNSTTTNTIRTTTQTSNQTRTGETGSLGVDTVESRLGEKVVDVNIVPFMRAVDINVQGFGLRPNRDLHVFFDGEKINDLVTPESGFESDSEGSCRTDENGHVEIAIAIPNGTFRTGDRAITLIDEANNVTDNASTYATYSFSSSGLLQTVQDNVISARVPIFESEVIQESRTVSNVVARDLISSVTRSRPIPAAATRVNGGGTCFDENAEVMMHDGSLKKIKDVKVGDKVRAGMNPNRANVVTGIEKPLLEDRKMFSFNDHWAFVSEEHPILTTTGWACFDPDSWATKLHKIGGKVVTQRIDVGSKVYLGNGSTEKIEHFQAHEADPEKVLYNLNLTGDHTYVVEGVVVHNKGGDPFAQTIKVSKESYPHGLFVPDVTCFFRQVGTLPVSVELRPVVNGYPHATKILPMSQVYKNPDEINLPTDTADIDSVRAAGTLFEFPVPIYLAPGYEYAVVLKSDDSEYEAYLSEMGERLLGTNTIIDKQPLLGSLFKSQNATTWTAFQAEDLMLKVSKCVFETGEDMVLEMFNTEHTAEPNVLANVVKFNPQILNFPAVTSISHKLHVKDSDTNIFNTDGVAVPAGENYYFNAEKLIEPYDAGDVSCKTTTTASTSSTHVASLIDLERFSFIAVNNLVNNLGLISSGFAVIDTGSGYTSTPSVTVTGGGGSGAVLEAVVESNAVVGINIINAGSGYTSAPTIAITGGGGSGADVEYEGFETDPFGGNAVARYMTRPITLADDFHTDFLKVLVDLNVQVGTSVELYYRGLSEDDPTLITDRPWTKMVQEFDTPIVSGSEDDFREVSFIPPADTISYVFDGATFPYSKVIQVKIVMLSNNTSVVPRCRDFRVITTAP